MKGPLLKYAEARSFGKEVSLLSLSENSTGKKPQTPKTQHLKNGSFVSIYNFSKTNTTRSAVPHGSISRPGVFLVGKQQNCAEGAAEANLN